MFLMCFTKVHLHVILLNLNVIMEIALNKCIIVMGMPIALMNLMRVIAQVIYIYIIV